MYRIISLLLVIFSSISLSAQFWLEDFGTDATCGIEEADGTVTAAGLWTVQPTGTNGSLAHNWYIGPREAQMETGDCGDGCLNDPLLEANTLYISGEDFNVTQGAVFQNNSESETNLRAVSPAISFVGLMDTMVVKLKYIYSGHPNTNCVLEYTDGTTWFDLWEIEETTGSCGDAGEWTETAIILPMNVLGSPMVQFGIRWENSGPDDMPLPELSFALGELECTCLQDETNEYPSPFDETAEENPVIEITTDGCSNSITETYILAPWAAALYGEPVIALNCVASANEDCVIEEQLIQLSVPGCGDDFTFTVGAGNFYSGPYLGSDGWGEVWLPEEVVCAGGCLEFSYTTGLWSDWAEVVMTMDVPGGTATFEQDPWDPTSIYGQICYDTPGTYTVTGNAAVCGLTEEVPAYVDVTVLPNDFEPEITVSDNNLCPGGCIDFSIDEMPDLDIEWTFEGGSPSSSTSHQPGNICFDSEGNFEVSVSVSGDGMCGYSEVQEGITIIDCGDPPVAAFSASTTTVCVGECIDFTDESTGTNNDEWDWVFSGATPITSEDQNPSVCYNSTGTFAVTLGVSNLAGSDILYLSEMIEVVECPVPSAAFSAGTTEICVGECIDFSDESSGPNINGWSWTFDGATTGTSDEQNPSDICYDTPGTYSVTLVVSNPNGSDEVTESALVVVDPCYPDPQPAFSVDVETICPGGCVSFTNESTITGAAEWNWDFDGADTPASSDESPANICYSDAGTYSITLTVTDEGGTESLVQTNLITVGECPEPSALFAVSEAVICPGECVQLENLSTGTITGYTWIFPDSIAGDTAAINPELCFDDPGTYSISLAAFNDDGETSEYTLEQAVVVDPCLPEISIEVSEDRICVGDCVSFNNASEEVSTNWQWTFQGAVNSTSESENPSGVCFHTPGEFDVTLQADFGSVTIDSTFSQMIHVIDSCGPVANFNYTPIMCLGQCYDFENTSTGGSDYFWVFEGAANPLSSQENPTEVCYLSDTGVFSVTLAVSNEFGSSTSITQQISVVNPPNLNAGPDQTITQGMPANLSATAGSGSGTFTWQPFEMVNCFSCASTPTKPLDETTTFVVFYEEPGGCLVSDTVTVFVEESHAFGVPGSFSPNGDGVNDVLYVRGSNITYIDFMVYNRYGQQVFRTTDQSEGWDGTFNGRNLDAGIFGYTLEIHQRDVGRSFVKGDIDLVR